MTDLNIYPVPGEGATDHSWAGSSGVFDSAQSGTLDVTKFTKGTHYDGTTFVLKSGIAVSKQATGTYKPLETGETLAGFIAAEVQLAFVSGEVSKSVLFARAVEGVIRVDNLPITAQKALVKGAATVCSFAWV